MMRRIFQTLGQAQSNRRCICVNNRVLKARLRFALAYSNSRQHRSLDNSKHARLLKKKCLV